MERKSRKRNRKHNDPSKMLDECELKMARLTLKMAREAIKLSKKKGNLPYIV